MPFRVFFLSHTSVFRLFLTQNVYTLCILSVYFVYTLTLAIH